MSLVHKSILVVFLLVIAACSGQQPATDEATVTQEPASEEIAGENFEQGEPTVMNPVNDEAADENPADEETGDEEPGH